MEYMEDDEGMAMDDGMNGNGCSNMHYYENEDEEEIEEDYDEDDQEISSGAKDENVA